jgi:NAD(P)-dependent dehydrogenase (short-subunit alcohol dehydrogenase family)
MRFAGAVAVVTGASRGIGRATAGLLAAEGATVVAAARNGTRLEELAGEASGTVQPVVCDVAVPTDVARLFRVAADAGGCSILVAAAGVLFNSPIEDTADDRWSETMAVNLTGAFLCSRAAFGQMRARGGGRIVLVSSLSGVYATEKFPGLIAYNASKHGVVGLMEGLAVEGRPHGIWAISVSPGAVDTEMRLGFTVGSRAGAVPHRPVSSPRPVGRVGARQRGGLRAPGGRHCRPGALPRSPVIGLMPEEGLPLSRMLVVAAGQMNPASDDKAVNVDTVLRLIDEAAGSGAAIICLPELSLTKYLGHWDTRDHADVRRGSRTVDEPDPRHRGAARDHALNTAVVIDGRGEIVSRYRKIHLPGSFPLEGQGAFTYERLYFTPGNLGFPVFSVASVGWASRSATIGTTPRVTASLPSGAPSWCSPRRTCRRREGLAEPHLGDDAQAPRVRERLLPRRRWQGWHRGRRALRWRLHRDRPPRGRAPGEGEDRRRRAGRRRDRPRRRR